MSGEAPASAWCEVRARLCEAEPAFDELEPGGALVLSLDDEGWILEVTPDGRVICQTGLDIEAVRCLLSDGTPEDLGTDELVRQAKYYLQPLAAKFRKLLRDAGFEERAEITDRYVAVTFQRAVDVRNFDELAATVRWCRRQFDSSKP